jgi:benzil reductase ((S)-benzoin forming)
MTTAVWITGSSSGIGAALMRNLPVDDAVVFGIARRASGARDLRLDLARPTAWRWVAHHFEAVLEEGAEHAVLLHLAGTGEPYGRAAEAPLTDYLDAVLTNGAAGLVLGKALLSAAARAGADATVVLCSSPAAAEPMPGMSAYAAGKAAMEYWVRAVAAEGVGRVLGVVPFAVDTPMMRQAMQQPDEVNPVAGVLRAAAANDALATPEGVAAEIWRFVLGDTPSGSIVAVGAVRSDLRVEGALQ